MKMREIYEHFGIPENLQEHMVRVAKVVSLITYKWKENIDRHQIIQAALVHDLANIVKFKLNDGDPLLLKQREVAAKYGSDDHEATEKMLRELNADENTIEIVQGKSFGNALEVANSSNWFLKILFYADMRVSPGGVVSLEERLTDVITRLEKYRNHPNIKLLMESARQTETQIQKMTGIKLEDINEQSLLNVDEDFLEFDF